MRIQECYNLMEADYNDVIDRLRKETLIARFIVKFPEDPSFDELISSMDKRDITTAFRAAHTLKGVCQNLGLVKLFAPVNEATEALRVNDYESAQTVMPQIIDEYNKTLDIINQYIESVEE